MVATRIQFATMFCLLSGSAAANAKMREQVSASVTASGVVVSNAKMREQAGPPVSASAPGTISKDVEIGLHMRQKKTERAVGSSTDVVSLNSTNSKRILPDNVSFPQLIQDLQTAYAGITEAVSQFTEGRVQGGLVTILNAAEALVVKYVPENVGAEISRYTALIAESVRNSEGIIANLNKFKDEADTEALAAALLAIIDEVEVYMAQIEQENDNIETGSILKYFEALEEIIRATSSSWSSFSAGANRDDIVSAMENIYEAVRAAVMKLVPNEDISQELQIALTVFDSTIGNMTSIAEGFKQEMEMKVLCLPKSIARNGPMPNVCPDGYTNQASRCIASAGMGMDCWQACGKKAGHCGSFCGSQTNYQKTVCCKEGNGNDPCECREATGYRVNNPDHPANSYYQCVTAGPWVQASGSSLHQTNVSLLEAVDQTAQKKNKPKCTKSSASAALAETAAQQTFFWGRKPAVARGSISAACASGTGRLCDKKCIQDCPAGSIEKGCKCRAMCVGEHPHEATVLGAPVCGKDASSISKYAMDAFSAGSTLATLIQLQRSQENSIKELSSTIQAGITLLQKLIIPACKVPDTMSSLLPPR